MVIQAGVPRSSDRWLEQRAVLTLALCTIGALVEGFDIQAMGVAGPPIIRAFALSPATAGWLFAGGTIGQVIGSLGGGRVADRIGRKWTLMTSLLLIGLSALGTVASTTIAALLLSRVLTGLGLGGALPNVITLASESIAPHRRHRLVTLLMAGLPAGAMVASLTSLGNGLGWGWRTIFVVGGAVPLVAGLLAIWMVNEVAPSGGETGSSRLPLTQVLFGGQRAPATLLLWASFFFTQLILLLMVSWLPALVVRSGFSGTQASWVQICLNVSGVVGSVIVGQLQSGTGRRSGTVATYLGIAAALAAAGLGQHLYAVVLLAAAAFGIFASGAQLSLYALAPLYYSRALRGTGVGSAATLGRLGSVAGPLIGGLLLSGGGNSATVLLGSVPFVVAGGAAALALCWRAQSRD